MIGSFFLLIHILFSPYYGTVKDAITFHNTDMLYNNTGCNNIQKCLQEMEMHTGLICNSNVVSNDHTGLLNPLINSHILTLVHAI